MRVIQNVVFPALCAAVMASTFPTVASAADATWGEAKDMPEVALAQCAEQMALRGYEIQGTAGGREIDRYVDLRYEATHSGRSVMAVCRYDSGRGKVTTVRESKS